MIGLCLLACVGAASAAAVKGSARSGGAWTSTAAGGLRLTKPAPIAGAGLSSRSIAPARVAGPYTATTRGAAGGSSSNWAVIFDYVSPTNYRYASVAARRGGGNGIFSVRGRSVRRLAAFRAVSARGSAHTLRVERRGSGVVVLRDGSVLATASGLGAPVGRVGVGTRGAAATFTRLQLARLDTTAPTSMIYEGPATDESTFDDGVSFVFEATERARFECSLDGGAFKSCASGVSYDGLAPGVHDFELRAIDAAGNVQQPTTHRIWHVLATGIVGGGSGDDDAPDPGPLDVRAPVLSISSGPAAGLSTAATSAAFMLTADEAARFECRIDTGAWEACTTNMTYAALAVGAHAFQARATDTAGNVSAVVQRAWTVVAGSSPPPTDTTAPTVAITSGPTAGSSTTATTAAFTFTSTEPGQFACRLDAGAWATCSSGISFGTLSVGSHTFAVKASDAQGNQSTSATRTWTIVTPPDTTAPTVTITGGPANGASTAATSASFTFSANEASAFTCTLDVAASTTCTTGVTYGSLAVGSHTWSIT
ncbi:MAG: putative internalin, partial [Thermoleophilia bacterium]|nr:putative internalin [Thermoleophilia bacterium]